MSTSAPASPLKAARRSLEAKAQAIRRNMSAEQLSKKAKEVRDLFKMPVTIRLLDRIAFVAGVMLVCATEYFVLVRPHEMHIFWVSLLVPLLLHRWVEFHAAKWHYFLLDFCYYTQALLLLYLYKYSYNAYFFQLVFCLSSGPLALAVIPWKNSLVFHDWGRVTSVFIHVFPPIVTFCLRWYAAPTHAVCVDKDCSISWHTSFLWPLVFYSFWQLAYLLKTELIDADKMKKDKELVTSLRWMTDFKPHPIYKAARKRGYTGSAVLVLVAFQFLYTSVTLAPTYFFYKYYWANAGALLVVVFTTVWNGASFYFEVFAERYAKEIQKQEANKGKILPSSWSSFFLTLTFLACFLGSLVGLLALFSAYHRV